MDPIKIRSTSDPNYFKVIEKSNLIKYVYFERMLQSSFIESEKREIILNYDPLIIDIVFKFLSTSVFDINQKLDVYLWVADLLNLIGIKLPGSLMYEIVWRCRADDPHKCQKTETGECQTNNVDKCLYFALSTQYIGIEPLEKLLVPHVLTLCKNHTVPKIKSQTIDLLEHRFIKIGNDQCLIDHRRNIFILLILSYWRKGQRGKIVDLIKSTSLKINESEKALLGRYLMVLEMEILSTNNYSYNNIVNSGVCLGHNETISGKLYPFSE